jgi:hypothetical protein
MAVNSITFDPDAGVPYGVNLTINTGSDFESNFNITGYSGSAQLAKSVAIGATIGAVATFNVGFTSAAAGKIKISLGSTSTRNLKEGRYVYDVIVSSGSTVYNIINGNILVLSGVSSAP